MHYVSKGAICVPLDDQEKKTYDRALCEGSMRIELRSELYAKGALCGSTCGLLKVESMSVD